MRSSTNISPGRPPRPRPRPETWPRLIKQVASPDGVPQPWDLVDGQDVGVCLRLGVRQLLEGLPAARYGPFDVHAVLDDPFLHQVADFVVEGPGEHTFGGTEEGR